MTIRWPLRSHFDEANPTRPNDQRTASAEFGDFTPEVTPFNPQWTHIRDDHPGAVDTQVQLRLADEHRIRESYGGYRVTIQERFRAAPPVPVVAPVLQAAAPAGAAPEGGAAPPRARLRAVPPPASDHRAYEVWELAYPGDTHLCPDPGTFIYVVDMDGPSWVAEIVVDASGRWWQRAISGDDPRPPTPEGPNRSWQECALQRPSLRSSLTTPRFILSAFRLDAAARHWLTADRTRLLEASVAPRPQDGKDVPVVSVANALLWIDAAVHQFVAPTIAAIHEHLRSGSARVFVASLLEKLLVAGEVHAVHNVEIVRNLPDHQPDTFLGNHERIEFFLRRRAEAASEYLQCCVDLPDFHMLEVIARAPGRPHQLALMLNAWANVLTCTNQTRTGQSFARTVLETDVRLPGMAVDEPPSRFDVSAAVSETFFSMYCEAIPGLVSLDQEAKVNRLFESIGLPRQTRAQSAGIRARLAAGERIHSHDAELLAREALTPSSTIIYEGSEAAVQEATRRIRTASHANADPAEAARVFAEHRETGPMAGLGNTIGLAVAVYEFVESVKAVRATHNGREADEATRELVSTSSNLVSRICSLSSLVVARRMAAVETARAGMLWELGWLGETNADVLQVTRIAARAETAVSATILLRRLGTAAEVLEHVANGACLIGAIIDTADQYGRWRSTSGAGDREAAAASLVGVVGGAASVILSACALGGVTLGPFGVVAGVVAGTMSVAGSVLTSLFTRGLWERFAHLSFLGTGHNDRSVRWTEAGIAMPTRDVREEMLDAVNLLSTFKLSRRLPSAPDGPVPVPARTGAHRSHHVIFEAPANLDPKAKIHFEVCRIEDQTSESSFLVDECTPDELPWQARVHRREDRSVERVVVYLPFSTGRPDYGFLGSKCVVRAWLTLPPLFGIARLEPSSPPSPPHVAAAQRRKCILNVLIDDEVTSLEETGEPAILEADDFRVYAP